MDDDGMRRSVTVSDYDTNFPNTNRQQNNINNFNVIDINVDEEVIQLLPDPSTGEERDSICQSITHFFQSLITRVRQTPLFRLLAILLLMVLLMGGNATQIIMLNWWFLQFPTSPGNYTIFAVSGFVFSTFFLLLLLVYVVCFKPDLRFALQAVGWRYLTLAGFLDTLNSGLAVYAASHTPPVLQAIFTALVPLYAAFFTKQFLKDDYRSYNNHYIRVSFLLIIAGVLLATVSNFYGEDSNSNNGGEGSRDNSASSFFTGEEGHATSTDSPFEVKVWALLFALSVPVVVLLNIVQTLYMTRYTHDPEFLAYVAELYVSGDAEGEVESVVRRREEWEVTALPTSHQQRATRQPTAPSASAAGVVSPPPPRMTDDEIIRNAATRDQHFVYSDDTSVKLVMLAGETALQCCFTLLWLPLDALPWYGGSDSISDAFLHFKDGLSCVLHCPNNLQCCVGYSIGFVGVYVGAAYLNQYSVTLCSMVSQLSGPVTALLLVVFPALNVAEAVAPWYFSLTAIALMTLGSVIYVVWDTKTEKEKIRGEMALKMEMFGLKDAVYGAHDDGNDDDDHYDDNNNNNNNNNRGRERNTRGL